MEWNSRRWPLRMQEIFKERFKVDIYIYKNILYVINVRINVNIISRNNQTHTNTAQYLHLVEPKTNLKSKPQPIPIMLSSPFILP